MGGMHNRAQSDPTLHFGLGSERQIDQLTVTWSRGISQDLLNLNGDRTLRVQEGSGYLGADVIRGTARADSLYGRNGNDTLIGSDGRDLLFGIGDDDVLQGGAKGHRLFGDEGND